MKYCVEFKKYFKYIDNVDEITINYRREDTTLLEFLLLHQHQRVNIFIKNEEDFLENNCIELFDAMVDEHPELNFCFKLKEYSDTTKEVLDVIQKSEKQYKYFFSKFMRDWDTLWGYIELKPCSMYITDELGFSIKTIAEILHPMGIEIRCFPNVAQSKWNQSPALKKFFIRPEDVRWYEPYVDVFEFFGRPNSLETYYKIYKRDKKWNGQLNEVIVSFNGEIDSRCLLPTFAKRRLNCGKRCLMGRKCRICDAAEQLSIALDDNDLMFNIDYGDKQEEDDEFKDDKLEKLKQTILEDVRKTIAEEVAKKEKTEADETTDENDDDDNEEDINDDDEDNEEDINDDTIETIEEETNTEPKPIEEELEKPTDD